MAVYQIDLNFNMTPFINDMMNATGMAFGRDGLIYISSRFDGVVYQVTPERQHVGLRGRHGRGHRHRLRRREQPLRGRPQRHDFQDQPQPPDLRLRHARAFHLRLSPGLGTGSASLRQRPHHFELRQHLPRCATTAMWRRSTAAWAVRRAWLSTPKAICTRRLPTWAARAWCGSRRTARCELFVSGPGIVGLAFSPSRAMIVATTNAIFRVDVGIRGAQFA